MGLCHAAPQRMDRRRKPPSQREHGRVELTFRSQLALTRIFPGLRSRWNTFAAWMCRRPANSWYSSHCVQAGRQTDRQADRQAGRQAGSDLDQRSHTAVDQCGRHTWTRGLSRLRPSDGPGCGPRRTWSSSESGARGRCPVAQRRCRSNQTPSGPTEARRHGRR